VADRPKKVGSRPTNLAIKLVEIGCLLFQFERELCVGKVSRALPLGGEIITLSALDFDADNIISYR
jgi:protocadherin Fat 1/2/3